MRGDWESNDGEDTNRPYDMERRRAADAVPKLSLASTRVPADPVGGLRLAPRPIHPRASRARMELCRRTPDRSWGKSQSAHDLARVRLDYLPRSRQDATTLNNGAHDCGTQLHRRCGVYSLTRYVEALGCKLEIHPLRAATRLRHLDLVLGVPAGRDERSTVLEVRRQLGARPGVFPGLAWRRPVALADELQDVAVAVPSGAAVGVRQPEMPWQGYVHDQEATDRPGRRLPLRKVQRLLARLFPAPRD